MSDRQQVVERGWDDRANLNASSASPEVREAVESSVADLDSGKLRVAEKVNGEWVTHQWLKKAVLLSFRLYDNSLIQAVEAGNGSMFPSFYDKVPGKFNGWDAARFAAAGFRVVPSAT